MTEWEIHRLGDLVKKGVLAISDGYRMRNEELGTTGIPFVRGGDIGDGWINTTIADHIRPEFIDRVKAKLARPGDVAFITKGTVGRAGRLRDGQPEVVFAPQVAYWRSLDADVLDSQFLFYLICGQEFQAALYGVKTHGAMVADYVSISQQHDFSFRLPDIKTQRQIGLILSSIDDKIELNRRMNETLEAMARALFKDWFIDFGPVRAKMEGRQPPGLSPEIAALFPDRLDEEGRPEGWRLRSIRELADTISKGTTPTKDEIAAATDPPKIRFIKVKDIDGDGNIVRMGIEIIPESVHTGSLKRSVLRSGDILFSIAGTIGRVAVIEDDLANSNINQALAFVRLRAPNEHFGLVLQNLKSAHIRAAADAVVVQGVQANVSLSSLGDFRIVVPTAPVLTAWNCHFLSIYSLLRQRTSEARTLMNLRDRLLPQLLSGALCVDNSRSRPESRSASG